MNTYLTRRDWLAAATFLNTSTLCRSAKALPYQYLVANLSGTVPTLPTGAYMPFDWGVGEVPATGAPAAGDAPKLTWNQFVSGKNSRISLRQATLRITSATDVWEDCAGTAQGNKGSDALQRNGFRVISPYTLGFLAHLDTMNS